jgi:hypothetical protein
MSEWFAFTSYDGRMAGLAQRVGGGPKDFAGVVVAILEKPCDLGEWQKLVVENISVKKAAEALVASHGGARIWKRVPLPETTLVFFPATVGDA